MRVAPAILLTAAAVLESTQLAGQSPSSDSSISSFQGGSPPIMACVSTVSAPRPSVVGRVADAGRNKAVTGASVTLSWLEVRYDDGSGLRIIGRTQEVRSGVRGTFEFCDLDSDLEASLSASLAKRSTAPVHVSLSSGPFATRMLFLPAVEDSVDASDRSSGLVLRGTVIGEYDLGLGDARVEIRDFTEGARTRDDGTFTLPTHLSGTQIMRVRRVGYEESEISIDLTTGNLAPMVIRLEKTPPSLETIGVRERMAEVIERSGFGRRARTGPGQYISAVDIALHRTPCVVDYIASVPGFIVRRPGRRCEASIGVQRPASATPQSGATPRRSCVALVVDDEKVEDISALQPRDVVGIELYRMATDPVRNGERKCATILIWTVRYTGPPL